MEANLALGAFSGFIGAIIITILMYLLKIWGQDLDIPFILGSIFVDIHNKAAVYTTGIITHLLAGAGWGIFYVFTIAAMGVTPNWPAGILWGFGHGIFVGVMMGTLAETHPYVGEDKPIKDPGILGHRWSELMPYWILGLHVIFGVSSLLIYHQIVG